MPQTIPEILIATTLREQKIGTGVHTQFSTFRDYLRSVDHPVRVVSSFSNPALLVNPVLAMRKVIRPLSQRTWLTWHRTWHSRFIRRALSEALRATDGAVIYAQDPLSAEAAVALNSGQPVILAIHSPGMEVDEWVDHGAVARDSDTYLTMRNRERNTLLSVNRLVFASEGQRTALAATIPEIEMIPSVVMPQFVNIPRTNGVASPTRDAISVGTLEPRKNHSFLIDVVAAARELGHEYSLTIVGEGPERRALEAQIERLQLTQQVSLRGRVDHDIGLELEQHRVYLHACRQESFGLASVEAMALGIPTIIGDSGVAELLESGVETHVWGSLDDAKAGAQLLVELLTNPPRMEELGQQGQRRFNSSFTVEAVAPRLAAYLTDAAG